MMRENVHLQKKTSRIWENAPKQAKAASIQQVLQASRASLPCTSPLSSSPIQCYCGLPGCTDPHCYDTRNHGIDTYYELRNGTRIYSTNIPPSNRNQGTYTTPATRAYAQNPQTPRPAFVSFAYSSTGNTQGYSFMPNDTSGSIDAGHIVGRQNGGFGHHNPAIFPQNRDYNQGHKGHFSEWRAQEDQVNKELRAGHSVQQTVKLYIQPPQSQSRSRSPTPQAPVHIPSKKFSYSALRAIIFAIVSMALLFLLGRRLLR